MAGVIDALNLACIDSIRGMIAMGNRSILARLRGKGRAALAGVQHHLHRIGMLLQEAAAIAFIIRCRVIDRR
ncbi:hypothetical protein [Rhizobium hainanense]|uniref:hypothetical protein n=1 Tax=Rhizobium hainanense TaxID=52131 RepID=UPI00096A8F64|nr:hypothetical protein [Rhizobium hainanense]